MFDVLSHDMAELVDSGGGGIAHQERDMDCETCGETYFDCDAGHLLVCQSDRSDDVLAVA